MIKTIIVENEPSQSGYLTGLLTAHFPEITIMAVCPTVLEAVEKINVHRPDLIFLDINLDTEAGGFEVLKFTKSVNYEVIFTTAHDTYAIKAIRFSALDFLLKPFELQDLEEALMKFETVKINGSKKNIDVLIHNVTQPDVSTQIVGIPTMTGWTFVPIADIIICRAVNNCTDFYLTGNRKITATKTLKSVDELMRDHNFFRIHESSVINLVHLKKYKKGGEGGVVELSEKLEADVARRRKDAFLKALSDRKMIFDK